MKISHWIVRNIEDYGNCALPNNLVDLYGIEAVEKALSIATGFEIIVEKRMIDDYVYGEINKRHHKEKLYVAIKKVNVI